MFALELTAVLLPLFVVQLGRISRCLPVLAVVVMWWMAVLANSPTWRVFWGTGVAITIVLLMARLARAHHDGPLRAALFDSLPRAAIAHVPPAVALATWLRTHVLAPLEPGPLDLDDEGW